MIQQLGTIALVVLHAFFVMGQEALLEGSAAEQYSNWEPAHRSDTWTSWQPGPDNQYTVLVTAYFENNTELDSALFETSVPVQLWLNSTDPYLPENRYILPVVINEPPMINITSSSNDDTDITTSGSTTSIQNTPQPNGKTCVFSKQI